MQKNSKHHQPVKPGKVNWNTNIENNPDPKHQETFEGLRAPRPYLLKLFARLERMAEKIDGAFAGQAFLPHLPPDHPANIRRFTAFLSLHREHAKLLSQALHLWMFSYGWTPLVIVKGGRNVSKKTVRKSID